MGARSSLIVVSATVAVTLSIVVPAVAADALVGFGIPGTKTVGIGARIKAELTTADDAVGATLLSASSASVTATSVTAKLAALTSLTSLLANRLVPKSVASTLPVTSEIWINVLLCVVRLWVAAGLAILGLGTSGLGTPGLGRAGLRFSGCTVGDLVIIMFLMFLMFLVFLVFAIATTTVVIVAGTRLLRGAIALDNQRSRL